MIDGGANGGWWMGLAVGVAIGEMIAAYKSAGPAFSLFVEGPVGLALGDMLAIAILGMVSVISMFSIMDTLQGKDQLSVRCFISGFAQGILASLGVAAGAYFSSAAIGRIIGYVLAGVGIAVGEIGLVSPKDCKVY